MFTLPKIPPRRIYGGNPIERSFSRFPFLPVLIARLCSTFEYKCAGLCAYSLFRRTVTRRNVIHDFIRSAAEPGIFAIPGTIPSSLLAIAYLGAGPLAAARRERDRNGRLRFLSFLFSPLPRCFARQFGVGGFFLYFFRRSVDWPR